MGLEEKYEILNMAKGKGYHQQVESKTRYESQLQGCSAYDSWGTGVGMTTVCGSSIVTSFLTSGTYIPNFFSWYRLNLRLMPSELAPASPTQVSHFNSVHINQIIELRLYKLRIPLISQCLYCPFEMSL
jgi:hypothetical protein